MLVVEKQVQTFLSNVDDARPIVFFAGGGISVQAGYPTWDRAAEMALGMAKSRGLAPGAAAYAEEKRKSARLYDLFQILREELPEPTFYDIAADVFRGNGSAASDLHRLLVRVKCRGIITTNFDECLLTAYVQECGKPPITDTRHAVASDDFFIAKPHGSINAPRTMVLTNSDWQRVENAGDLKELLAQIVSTGQVIFVGYSMRDPDFNRLWDRLLKERYFKAPALYCCREGDLSAGECATFRDHNVQVIEFPDDGSYGYLPSLLNTLIQREVGVSIGQPTPKTDIGVQDLERYVLLCLEFSPSRTSRLTLVAKAIILEALSLANTGQLTERGLFRLVYVALGQDSKLINEAISSAIQELQDAKVLSFQGDILQLDAAKITEIADRVQQLDKAEQGWVGHALGEQAKELGLEIGPSDHAHVSQILDRVLLALGREVAELFLFNRLSQDEAERIDQLVERFCSEKDVAARYELYRRTTRRLLLDPSESEEDALFKRLQSSFIASAYILNPTSERLLAQYAVNHWAYFDSSIVLPALATAHPSNSVYRRLLSRTAALGMKLKIIREMVNEVWANAREAIEAFKEFSHTEASLQDVLEAYVVMHGYGNGNVFLEGFLNQLRLDPSTTPASYISGILGTSMTNVSEGTIIRALSDALGIECDTPQAHEIDEQKLIPIVNSIEHLRKFAGRFKNRLLCEHEARQFYLIHLRREQNPELAGNIWFITTDRFVSELQWLEQERYPLPIAYSPRRWFQYLDLVDFDSRGSRHFSRLQPKMRFGAVSGDLGIDAIRTILEERRDLLKKGAVTVKELAEAAVKDYHVRQAIADYDRSAGAFRQDDALKTQARDRVTTGIRGAVGQFVAVRTQELERLEKEKHAAQTEAESLKRTLEKKKYELSTLKAQQRHKKTKKRRH